MQKKEDFLRKEKKVACKMLYLPLCGSKQKKQCITVAGNGTFLHLSIKGPLCDVLGRGVNKVSRELVLLFKTLI